MNELETITKQKILGKEFTVYGTVEEPLFLAKDVAEMIDYAKTSQGYFNVSMMLQSVDDDEKITINILDSEGKAHNQSFLTENGLYEVLMLSRKPVAKDFKKVIKGLLHNLRTNKVELVSRISKEELEIADRNSRLAEADYWRSLADRYSGNKNYEQILLAYSTKAIAGKFVLPLPHLEEENYSATEVGNRLGISANRLGIKVDGEFGKWYVDKSPHSNKEVNTFRYTQKAIALIEKEIA